MPVIVLIDEYDVPLDKAYQNGYYPQMVNLIRSVFSQVLKTNENLEFAVITGCLQIAKEAFSQDLIISRYGRFQMSGFQSILGLRAGK